MAATKSKRKRKTSDGRPARNTTLFADEVFWAGLVASLTGVSVAKVISPLVRDDLRRQVRSAGVDPDKAWADYETASRH